MMRPILTLLAFLAVLFAVQSVVETLASGAPETQHRSFPQYTADMPG